MTMRARMIKPLRQNAQPRPPVPVLPFTKSAEWDADIFANAAYFRVTRRAGPGRLESHHFDSLLDALRSVTIRKDGRFLRDTKAMVYAVAKDERSFCLAPKDWLAYVKKWKLKHPDKH